MCGRFVSATPPDRLAEIFGVEQVGERLAEPEYNVAPTNRVTVVAEIEDVRRLEAFRWGLVPFWAKDLKIGSRMVNARAETLATKNAFRRSLRERRCIIPADGFYEWTMLPGHERKTPMYIRPVGDEPFAFAGLWDTWRDPDEGVTVATATIVTGRPNERIAEIHDRMPVILPRAAWDTWLDADNHDTELLTSLLVPAPADVMTLHAVSTEVNNPRSSGAALIDPVDPETGERV